MELLKAYFHSQGFSDTEAMKIAEAFTCKSLPKGSYFIEEGKPSRHFGFIEKGFLQYYVMLNGEEKQPITSAKITLWPLAEQCFIKELLKLLLYIAAEIVTCFHLAGWFFYK